MTNINFQALLNISDFKSKIQEINAETQSTAQKFARFGKIAAGALATAAGAAAVAIKSQINYADALGETAQKLGVSTEALSAYSYAAKMSGVEQETLEKALGRLNRQMVDNATTFEQLGISVRNTDGSLRESTDVMTDIAAVLSEMPDGAEKSALAIELLGKSGADLIPLFNQGADGIARLQAEAASMGLVITQEQADAAGEFNDTLDRLSSVIQGKMIQAMAALLPYLQGAIQWWTQLSDETKTYIGYAAAIVGGLATLSVTLSALGLIFGGLTPVVAGLGVAFNLLMSPITLVILAIAAVGAAIAATIIYWDEITAAVTNFANYISTTLTTALNTAWTYIKDQTTALKDWFVQKWTEIINYLMEIPAKMLDIGNQIIQGLWDGLQEKWASVTEWFSTSVTGLIDEAKAILGIQSPSKVFEEIGGHVVDGFNIGLQKDGGFGAQLGANLSSWVEGMRQGADQAANVVTSAYSKMEDALVNFVKTGKLDFSSLIDSMLSDLIRFTLRSALFGTEGGGGGLLGGLFGGGGFLSGIFGGLFSRNGNAFGSSGQLNFANGGVFNQKFAMPMGDGRMAIGAEAGPEAIMPLQRGSDGRLGVIATAGGGSSGQTIVNNFSTTINPGPNTSPQDARKFAAEFNRAVEQKVMETMAKRQNVGVGGRR